MQEYRWLGHMVDVCLTFYFFIYFYFEYQEVHGSRIAEAWLGEF